MIKANEFYVINQPKHASIVVVDMGGANLKTPLSPQLHETLDQLREDNDLVFMFPGYAGNQVSLDKFSTLYQACMYVVEGEDDTYTFVRTLDYIREIFNSHVQVGFMRYDSAVPLDCIFRLKDTKLQSLKSSILEIGRYNSEEFFKIYKKESWKKDTKKGIYRIYYTKSPMIRLSIETVDILRAIKPDYYSTFSGGYLWDFVPSAIMYFGIEYIKENVYEKATRKK